jgi:D-beta-D-heptose 7-phosphate kinase/D-beta-D-heptose 1-phosphate adenosyltransferase
MNKKEYIAQRVYPDTKSLVQHLHALRFLNRTIIFSNGCFDVLHPGHFHLLNTAASLAEMPVLVIGLNSDASVGRLKGANRPLHTFEDRAMALASLYAVDAVIGFEEDTPANLIDAIRPDILVKGGDYQVDEIVGAKEVLAYGGRVELVSFLPGHSTTSILSKK